MGLLEASKPCMDGQFCFAISPASVGGQHMNASKVQLQCRPNKWKWTKNGYFKFVAKTSIMIISFHWVLNNSDNRLTW